MHYSFSLICLLFRYYYPKHNRPDTPEGLQDNINRHFECLVAVIDDVVRSLPDISSHVAFLRRLGTMHADVEIQQRLLELMGPVFCNTVRPLLLVQGKWSFKVKHYIVNSMLIFLFIYTKVVVKHQLEPFYFYIVG